MKSKHFFLFVLSFMTALTAMASEPWREIANDGKPSIEHPYAEFNLEIADLDGNDEYWYEGPDFRIQRYPSKSYDDLSFYCGRLHQSKPGEKNYDEVLAQNNYWKVVLVKIFNRWGNSDHPSACIRVYNLKDPLGGCRVIVTGKWDFSSSIWRVSSGNRKKNLTFDFSCADRSEILSLENDLKSSNAELHYQSNSVAKFDVKFKHNSEFARTFKISNGPVNTTCEYKGDGITSFSINMNNYKKDGRYTTCVEDQSYLVTETIHLDKYANYTYKNYQIQTKKFASPTSLTTDPDQWKKRILLTWDINDRNYENKKYNAGRWYVYRRDVGSSDYKLIGEKLSLIKTVGSDVYKFTDNDTDLEFEKHYEYSVCFYPDNFLKDNGGDMNPADGPFADCSVTNTTAINRTSPFTLVTAVPLEKSIKVVWQHQKVPSSGYNSTPKYSVQRRMATEDNWSDIKEVSVRTDNSEDSYEDTNITSNCTQYEYRVLLNRGDTAFVSSSTGYTRVSGETEVKAVKASTGAFQDHTIVTWNVNQIGSSPTKFILYRRDVNEDKENWSNLHSVEGTSSDYSFTDATCAAGHYYEYKVSAFTKCDGDYTVKNSARTYGFSRSVGVISGQVTFDGGTAVDSVRVELTPNSNTENTRKFYYATKTDEESQGISVNIGKEDGDLNNNVIGQGRTYSIALWTKALTSDYNIVSLMGSEGSASKSLSLCVRGGKLQMQNGTTPVTSGIDVPKDKWTFCFMTREGNSTEIGIIDSLGNIMRQQLGNIVFDASSIASMAVGMQKVDALHNGSTGGSGYFDEVRVYNKKLTDREILRSYDRMLSGNESGLKLYWPMNEGIYTGHVYDYSSTNDVPNNSNGRINAGVEYTEDTPNESGGVVCYGLTSQDGSYTISGIPFAGNGTTYTVTPTKGVHEFNMSKQTRYISGSSLVYSGVDFTDKSSFLVHGTVRYAGTTIPVDSCSFEVDGIACIGKDKKLIETASDGSYTISVPIGSHNITVKRNNHTFVSNGRYPAGDGDAEFLGEVFNLDFEDNTLVNFAGRIVGGFRDRDLPVGFAQSVNNIGTAELVLTLSDKNYLLNATKVVSGTTYKYEASERKAIVESNTSDINSQSYIGAKTADGDEDCRKVFIHTDPETGEFSAMLPPVKYVLDRQALVNDANVILGEKFSVDLSDFRRASNDTLYVDSAKTQVQGIYNYQCKYVADYHTKPVFKVHNRTFGEKQYIGYDGEKKYTIDNIYTDDGSNVKYNYGYPVFFTGNEYEFELEAYEDYQNIDMSLASTDRQPLSGCTVQIANNLSSTQTVVVKGGKDDQGGELKEGDVYGQKLNGVNLDSDGKATYTWCAGLPNTNKDTQFAQTITMTLFVGSQANEWHPDTDRGLVPARSEGGIDYGMKGVNLGSIMLGNKFVTSGPDKTIMILRDPPGAKSSATWKKGSSVSWKLDHNRGGGLHNKSIVTHAYGIKQRVITGTAIGAVAATETVVETANNVGGGLEFFAGRYNGDIDSETFTTTEDISTSSGTEFVGSWGDVYVGTGRNYIFGDAREVYITENGKIDIHDVTGMRDSVTTAFRYSQLEILNDLIPRYHSEIKKLLKPYPAQLPDAKSLKEAQYFSHLSESDPNYGCSNYDEAVWGKEAKTTKLEGNNGVDGKSYTVVLPANKQDDIQMYHNQIKIWQNTIKRNEQEKVEMFENRNSDDQVSDNFSFDGGAKDVLNYTWATSHADYTQILGDEEVHVLVNHGTDICGFGIKIDENVNSVTKQSDTTTEQKSNTESFSFTLADNDYCSHTVDVYRVKKETKAGTIALGSKYGYSPIFRTRAGYTYGPYEDGDSTRFYCKGTEIMAKTIQMDVPQLIIDNPIQSNVPNGGTATFKIKMSNQSYANANMYFLLGYDQKSNPGSALLTVDGMALNGLKFYLPYNTTVEKTIQLKQTDKSILDYNDIKISLSSCSQSDATSHWPVISSVVSISAHFVPVSSDVSLGISNSVLNTQSSDRSVTFTVKDFDANHEGLKALRLQYRYANNPDWITVHSWVTKTDLSSDEENLAAAVKQYNGMPKYKLDMKDMPDGTYTFRMFSETAFGNNSTVTKESELVTLTKDCLKPTLISQPTPANGVLGIGSEISAEFNEDISYEQITKDNNIEVYGTLDTSDNTIHATAVQSDENNGFTTSEKIDLRDKEFTVEFWARNSEGNMLSVGTYDAITALGIHDNKPYVVIGDYVNENGNQQKIESDVSLSDVKDKWVYYQLTYKPKSGATLTNKLSLTAAYDGSTVTLIDNADADNIQSNGKMTVAKCCSGQYNELSIWNYARTWAEAAATMNKSKTGLERGLAHYWQMNEGNGTLAEDKVSGNNINVHESAWYYSGVNYSVALENGNAFYIPFGDSNIDDNDSYALDFWFNKSLEQEDKDVVLMRDDNGGIAMGLLKDGALTISTKLNGQESVYTSVGTIGNGWHHVVMNVQRGVTANVYVDGTNQIMLQEQSVPVLSGANIVFGGDFNGEIDEIRIWKGCYTTEMLCEQRFNRIDTATVKGLVRYYPFEHTTLDAGNQVVTNFSLHCATEPNGSTIHDIVSATPLSQGSSTPPLKVAPHRTTLSFGYSASRRKITITIPDNVLSRLEGTTVDIVLKNISDLNGNRSNPVAWNVFVSKNPLDWVEGKNLTLDAVIGEPEYFYRRIINKGGSTVNWRLNLPSWITATPSSGTLEPQGNADIEFTIKENLSGGNHSAIIGLYNVANNVSNKMNLMVRVKGNEPNWSVDNNDKEYSIPMTARIICNGSYSEDEADIVGAFVKGVCVGVSHVQYNSTRNTYYVNMTMQGGVQQLNDSISFKFWDSNTGIVYTPLIRKGCQRMTFTASSAPFGSYDNPEILFTGNSVEQSLNLSAGWNWISFYVSPSALNLNSSLKATNGNVTVIKTQEHSALWNDQLDDEGEMIGFVSSDLTSVNERSMYALYAKESCSVDVAGRLLTGSEGIKKIIKGWNWLRNPFYKNQSVTTAFAGFSPYDADVLQARDSYAQWSETYKRWDGVVTNFMPGVGYKYYSGDDARKDLFYDITLTNRFNAAKGLQNLAKTGGSDYGYAENMTILSTLSLTDSQSLDMDTVKVYATNNKGDLFFTTPSRGYYVLTVAEDDAVTERTPFSFYAFVNGTMRKLYSAFYNTEGQLTETKVTFLPDDVVGTFRAPLILTDNREFASGIEQITMSDIDSSGSYEVYSPVGYRILSGKHNGNKLKQLPSGVYIVNGRKMAIINSSTR